MTGHASTALDLEAVTELKRYAARARTLLIGGILGLVVLVAVLPAVDLSLFERLLPVVGGILSVVVFTALGSLRRAKAQEEILGNATWHRHKCEYAAPGIRANPGLILHGGTVLTLRTGVIWRIGRGGLPGTTHIEVADTGGGEVVLRVPGNRLLFTARVGPSGVERPL